MNYLSAKDILQIHSMLIDETGGSHGVREKHTVLSLENLPRQRAFGKELYPTIFEKAAVYMRSIIQNHPFIDGNKRTGVTCASIFLEDNGYQLIAKRGEIEDFAVQVAVGKEDVKTIANWFKKHSKKLR